VNEKELEELRYDVAHHLLSKMSAGSQFQYALDRMLQLCALYDEERLKALLPKHNKKSKGGGF
jgi:hypothetical protein